MSQTTIYVEKPKLGKKPQARELGPEKRSNTINTKITRELTTLPPVDSQPKDCNNLMPVTSHSSSPMLDSPSSISKQLRDLEHKVDFRCDL